MKKSNWIKFGGMGVVLYLVFLIATIPAHLVVSQISVPRTVQLGMVSGTVWDGKFNAVLVNGILLKNVRWSFSPSALLTGKLGVDFKISNSRRSKHVSAEGFAYLGFSGFATDETKVNIPAALFKQRFGLSMIDSVTGVIRIDLDHFRPDQPYCAELDGKVKWKSAELSVMNALYEVGDINLDLKCADGGIVAQVKGDEKYLSMNVEMQVPSPGQIEVNGQIKAGEMAAPLLANSLSFLGQANEEGFFPVQFKNF
ncbi:type II secretion system protein N [Catenovulum sp. SM1970]|uniref:type II secretion system protein N n=1 Tax=Marinifaba aquimaris TaxID=2741323 RepID=UPI0015731C0E|nr:type II secretion system protein N [Marinifaba aquimaris]NTS75845.1 type II secretion system protein N [Marinifaba aquimaris]